MPDEDDKVTRLRPDMKTSGGEGVTGALPGDTCSFCGKKSTEVGRLIAGPSVFICDQCVAECSRLIDRNRT